MFEMLLAGFAAVLSVKTILLIMVGVIFGLVMGALPGLSTTMAMALAIPLTFGMEKIPAMSMLMGIFIGGVAGGLVSAILINIPGTPACVATTFDGFPMAQKGQAGKAIGVSIISAFIGGLLGIMVLMLLAPPLAQFALKFGPYEYFSIGVFSLSLIITLSEKSMIKGFLSGLLGVAFTTVGTAPIDGFPRFTFGVEEIGAGFDLLPFLIGLFAVSQILKLSTVDPASLKRTVQDFKGEGKSVPFKEYLGQKFNLLRSSLIGIGIGILPGIGAGTSNILAYMVARRQSKYPEKFGTGITDGLVASESSGCATTGGALIPLLTVGIPGDTITAMLLGGLILHGLTPGPLLFIKNGDVVYSIFAALLVANFMMLIITWSGIRFFVKALSIPEHYLYPIIFVLCLLGAYGTSSRIFDIWCMLFFGLVTYFLEKRGFPMTPMILGFILGPIIETNLRRGLMHSSGSFMPFLTEPISAVFLAIAVISVIFALRQQYRQKKEENLPQT